MGLDLGSVAVTLRWFIHSSQQLWNFVSRAVGQALRLHTWESAKPQAIRIITTSAAMFPSCDQQVRKTRWLITFKHTSVISAKHTNVKACLYIYILCSEWYLPPAHVAFFYTTATQSIVFGVSGLCVFFEWRRFYIFFQLFYVYLLKVSRHEHHLTGPVVYNVRFI